MRSHAYVHRRLGLHHRMFLWLAMAIATTALALGVGYHAVSLDRTRAQNAGAQRFVAKQFARLWNDPEGRRLLAAELGRDFHLRVEVLDLNRRWIDGTGGRCLHALFDARVEDASGPLGHVRACPDVGSHVPFWAPLVVAVLLLWAVSRAIAWRIALPLWELARVARDIGQGKWSSRVELSPRAYYEARVVGDVVNEMACRIEKQLADQKALLAAVSHELRTPLARMRLLIEMARGGLGEDARAGAPGRKLDELDAETTAVDVLVGDLLASSRVDFSALHPTRQDAVCLARDVLERAGLDPTLVVTTEPSVWFEADATLMVRALTNLAQNAERHGGGLVALRIEVRPGFVAFVFEDAGGGFAPGDEARAFEPFYHRGATGSVGLGLSLVRRIAEAHGGRAYAENRSAGGARVGIEVASTIEPTSADEPAMNGIHAGRSDQTVGPKGKAGRDAGGKPV